MLDTITQWLELCIDINLEISEVYHYPWTFTFRIFKPALEITTEQGEAGGTNNSGRRVG